ncbi:hypothetical protein AVEN_271082-1 [Araneus ventricosus]|uniref:Uncharacterized protein n=1 Tax=Araneus ventricosus TaxID=182803 RepID=A0A4Y2FE80_ARAVE|nr:hypothetical protein AVEN_271082-1 [Araneus ventricosus]
MRIMLKLWEKIKSNFTGQAEDRKIDAGNELRNLRLYEKEKISDYCSIVCYKKCAFSFFASLVQDCRVPTCRRTKKSKCASLGLDVTERELVFYVVRGLTGKYAKIRVLLKTRRERSIDELLEILREEETQKNNVGIPAFTAFRRQRQKRMCYFCRKPKLA